MPNQDFPRYTKPERAADLAVHLAGIAAAVVAAIWLLVALGPDADLRLTIPAIVYAIGLVGMLAASAAYNLVPPSVAKARLQRLDHAMIFVMIAGTYTPFTLIVLQPVFGAAMCALVWTLALTGVCLKLGYFRRVEHVSLGLYLGMGWLLVLFIRPMIAGLSSQSFALLLAGGIVYSAGSLLHTFGRHIRFHNAVWHAMVVAAAILHFAAVARLLLGSA